MRRMLFLLSLFILMSAYAKEYREVIVVIDSGIKLDSKILSVLCENGLKDFTKEGMQDSIGHGTNVTNIIVSKMQRHQCLSIIKFYSMASNTSYTNEALLYAMALHPAYINLSLSGLDPDNEEYRLLSQIVKKTKVIVSAGNNSVNFDKGCNVYPACYKFKDNFYVVGSVDSNGKVSHFSNFGKKVEYWENGENVAAGGVTLSGTSQAAAIFTSKLIVELSTLRMRGSK